MGFATGAVAAIKSEHTATQNNEHASTSISTAASDMPITNGEQSLGPSTQRAEHTPGVIAGVFGTTLGAVAGTADADAATTGAVDAASLDDDDDDDEVAAVAPVSDPAEDAGYNVHGREATFSKP